MPRPVIIHATVRVNLPTPSTRRPEGAPKAIIKNLGTDDATLWLTGTVSIGPADVPFEVTDEDEIRFLINTAEGYASEVSMVNLIPADVDAAAYDRYVNRLIEDIVASLDGARRRLVAELAESLAAAANA